MGRGGREGIKVRSCQMDDRTFQCMRCQSGVNQNISPSDYSTTSGISCKQRLARFSAKLKIFKIDQVW